MHPESIVLRLSEHELAFLLENIGVFRLAGMAALPYGTDTLQEKLVRRAQAHRSLMARGLMGLADDKWVFDISINQIMSLCAFPRHILTIAERESHALRPSVASYYVSPPITILHHIPVIGIHDFYIVSQPIAFGQMLSQRIEVTDDNDTTETIAIERSLFTALLKSSLPSSRNAGHVETAVSERLPAEIEPIAQTLAKPHSRFSLQVAESTEGKVAANSLSLIHQEFRCWSVQGLHVDDPQANIVISSVNQTAFTKALSNLLQPLPQ